MAFLTPAVALYAHTTKRTYDEWSDSRIMTLDFDDFRDTSETTHSTISADNFRVVFQVQHWFSNTQISLSTLVTPCVTQEIDQLALSEGTYIESSGITCPTPVRDAHGR